MLKLFRNLPILNLLVSCQRVIAIFLTATVALFHVFQVFGQNALSPTPIQPSVEIGTPFIQHFDPEEYQASTQNWDIVQDSLGLIYIANGRGLLIYNGETFDLLKMPNGLSVRALAMDEQQRIYCGGAGYFGYLTYQEQGKIEFVNLVDSISSAEISSFSNVEDIYCTPKGVYFRSPERLFLWKNDNYEFWDSDEHRFFSSFWVKGQLYINRKDLGIQVLTGDGQFISLAGGTKMAGKMVTLLLPRGPDLLVGTNDSLFLWKQNMMLVFETPASDLLLRARLFNGRLLNDKTYALSTLNAGMFIMDESGQILVHCDTENGLASNTIHQIYQDKNEHLWIACNNGISLVEYPSPFSIFKIGNKTPPISALTRYNDDLIVGTFNGLFRVRKSQHAPAYLEPYLGVKDRIWDLLVLGNNLLIGFEDGLYIKTPDQDLQKISSDAISDLWQSRLDSNRVIVAARKGLFSLYFDDGEWLMETPDVDVGEGVYHIHQQDDGTLWLDVNKPWIYRVTFPSINDAARFQYGSIEKLDSMNGLPSINGYVMMHADQIYYVDNADLRMFRFDSDQERFTADFEEESAFSINNEQLVIANDDKEQNKWVVEFEGDEIKNTFLVLGSTGDGGLIKLAESRIYALIGRCIYYDGAALWHGGRDLLIRHDLKQSTVVRSHHTIIDKVYYRDDSLVSSGPYRSVIPRFPFTKNQFRFTYANTAHVPGEKEEYQYYLEGLSDHWSKWSSEAKRDYTNLTEGTYAFIVRSKSVDGTIGKEDTFRFKILAPWYRSWWAYVLYFSAAVLGSTILLWWRSRKLHQEKIDLQNIIELRTVELEVRNEELEKQKIQLSEQTVKLQQVDQFKSQLFANISHEFRTPLTLIKGPLDRLRKFPNSQLTSDHLDMMDRNADRLLRLVNQILDLSKIDASDLPLNLAEGNVLRSIRASASTFSSHAADRNVDYRIQIPAGQLWAAFDRDKLEKIIYNLLSNAFKFTSDAGSIEFSAIHAHDVLQLNVIDTGRGISSANLPKIFDRFYQIDAGDAKEHEGSGVGLSLVKELVSLMGGTVHVDSVLGQGSSFFVELPMEQLNRSAIEAQTTERLQVVPSEKLISHPTEDLTTPGKPQTILLVEDNPDMRTYIHERLEDRYRVLEAHNGPEGLKLAIDKMPDLVITDLMMPKMDGLELCSIIKSDLRTSHMPVIMLTAKAGLENRLEGLQIGADVYLTKPFLVEELLVQINRLIEERVRLRALFSQAKSFEPKDLQLPKLDRQFMEKVLQVLEEKYSHSDFDVPALHQILAMSRTQLHRKMKALTGMAPGEFIRHFRLKRAAQILLRGENVAQTAYGVGFNNLSYFARSFRALHGVSPKEYANQHRED